VISQILYRFGRRPESARSSSAPAFRSDLWDPPLQTRLLVLQPTPFCNIRCDYCYLPDRDSKARMTVATARLAMQRLADDGLLGSEITVSWHAGEPLAMPRAFYEEAIDALQEAAGPGCRVSHALQTNATLIDAAWCDLFLKHRVSVGVSIDGPADLHDAHRLSRNGRGTHASTLRGIARLRDHGIAFSAIAVVTAAALDRADDFAEFFETLGCTELGCNFDEAEGAHAVSSLAGREAAHGRFMTTLFERALAGGGQLRLREFENARRLVSEPLPPCRHRSTQWPDNAQVRPFALVSVSWNGDFSSFSPELLGQASADFDDFALGNVATSGYLDSTRREPFISLWAAIGGGVEACRERCAYFNFCGGGAPVNKLYENGRLDSAETLYCRVMLQRPFDLALARAEASLSQVA
jgi:uncharacterized protein